MAYEILNEIILKTDFEARDVTIINYNSTIAQIKGYLEKINLNTEFVLQDLLRNAINVPFIHYGYTLPEETVIHEGDLFIEIKEEV